VPFLCGLKLEYLALLNEKEKILTVNYLPVPFFRQRRICNESNRESRDLIADYPELVRELETAWDAWYGSFSKQRFDEKEENPRQLKRRTEAHMGDKGSGVPYVPVAMP